MGMSQDELALQTANSLPWALCTPDGQPFPGGQTLEHLVVRTGRPLHNVCFVAEITDGRRLLLSVDAAPLLGESGQLDGVVVALEDITARQEAEERLKVSLREKEVLLKEIHHRVKNNLQVISSLLDMQSLSIQSPEAIEVLEDNRHRVRTMAFVHERLYQSEDLASIDVREYLDSLTSYLLSAYECRTDDIRLNLQVEDVCLDPDAAIAIGLIVNELVSNALKHAFPPAWEGEGEIGVELGALADGRFRLQVTDNGVGFPPQLDLKATGSLGLRLVTMLTQQLQGTLELGRGAGTIFKIIFPGAARTPSKEPGNR
jgi:two-component sensor histidine kinase